MTELTPKERLQPSLLDRLTDDEPERRTESADKRVLSLQRLRESVRRDLGWLLNTPHLASLEDLSAFPEIRRSTLNYGIPDLAGRTASTVDRNAVAKEIKRAILDFEPRLLERTVKVRALVDKAGHAPNSLKLAIEAHLWSQPLPLKLYFRTDVDLEDGEAAVEEVVEA
ncbi:MAG: type VI secretion system baseplate subunit TssE [Polyangiaceae bacterium]